MSTTGLTIILFSVVAGVVLMGAVGCFIIIRRKKLGQDLTTWKMTPFPKVHCGGAVVAVKKLWSRGEGRRGEARLGGEEPRRHQDQIPQYGAAITITAQQKKRLHDFSRKSSSFVFTLIASYMISSSEPLYSTGHIPCLATLGLFITVELTLSKQTMTLQVASNLVTLSGAIQFILIHIMLVSFNEYYGLAALLVPLLLIAVAIKQAYKHVGGTNDDGSDKQQLESDTTVFDSIFDFASDTVNLGGLAAMFSGRYMASPATIVGFVFFFTVVLGIYLMMITTVRTAALTPHAKYLIVLLKALRWITVITAMIHVGRSSGGD
ncbi:hypothetical protein BS78_07G065600 [Paspalum vaginatum]|nr:hypothetical protein BS78_07G065600 [Paspalum vaginatum]